jgi:hypothetical protein
MKILTLHNTQRTIKIAQMKSGIILLASTTLITLYCYWESIEFATPTQWELPGCYSAILMLSMSTCSRRDFIAKLSVLVGAVLASCTPLNIVLKNYPEEFDNDDAIKLDNLKAFVITIIPGADINDKNLCRIFSDSFYGFNKYCGFFVSDLCTRSKKMFDKNSFCDLTAEQKTEVVLSGLNADTTLNKIYSAAIFMSQVSYYSSIYDDENGCQLIDFNGPTSFVNSEMSYKNPKVYLASEITENGNYN